MTLQAHLDRWLGHEDTALAILMAEHDAHKARIAAAEERLTKMSRDWEDC